MITAMRTSSPTSGAAFVLLALFLQEAGAAIAVLAFPAAGPVGMVALRLCLSALLLWPIVRPRLSKLSRQAWVAAARYGLILAAMNVFFYLALGRLYLGTAVTLEVLGPLALSVIAGRRWISTLWAFIALVGVFLLGSGDAADLDPLGVIFALTAAALWACYILATKNTGKHFIGLVGLTLGVSIGGIAVLPIAIATTGVALFHPHVLLLGFGIAILSSAAPYALEMLALRRIPAATFAILLALAPAIAALAGTLVLHQTLPLVAWVGVVLVVVAGIGATATPLGNSRPDLRVAADGVI